MLKTLIHKELLDYEFDKLHELGDLDRLLEPPDLEQDLVEQPKLQLVVLQSLHQTLEHHLQQNPRVLLFLDLDGHLH